MIPSVNSSIDKACYGRVISASAEKAIKSPLKSTENIEQIVIILLTAVCFSASPQFCQIETLLAINCL